MLSILCDNLGYDLYFGAIFMVKFSLRNFSYDKSYPILAIVLCAGFLFYKYVLQIYPSTITQNLMAEFSLSATGLGNLAATFYYSYILAQLIVGPIIDKYSMRYLTAMAILACGISTLCFAHTHSLLFAQLARVVMGIGVSFATIVYLQVAATWFAPKHYALVSGLLPTAAMAGAFFGQGPLTLAIEHLGWRSALYLVGWLGIILAGLFFAVMRDKPHQEHTDTSLSLKDIVLVVWNKQNWLLTLYSGLVFTAVVVFGSLWGNPFLQEAYHIGKPAAAGLVSLVFVGLACGGPIFGILAQRVANRLILLFNCTLVAFIALALVLYCHMMPIWLLGSLLFIFGFVVGAAMIVYSIAKESNSCALTATVITMINSSDGILTGITEPGIGKILDATWDGSIVNGVHHFKLISYQLSLSTLAIYLFIACLLLWWVKDEQQDNT